MTAAVASAARTRTVEWEDPLEALGRAAGMTGREHLEAIGSGEIPPPPIAVLMGFGPIGMDDGVAVFALEPGEHLYNPIGGVHGGAIATLIDSVTGCAVQTTLPAGVGYATTSLEVRFHRPVTRDSGRIVAEGRVIHRGSRVAVAEAKVTDESTGKLIASGSATCMLLTP
ncbi:MAG TPA: PaaI family thioesterase [Thermoleophilaceae bacterium]|nr:PaaI family thioesterase [Thermoleophilaceae bacterium]